MALDLFVNFERHSNSSLFYRVTSSSPSVFTVELKDPAQDLTTIYFTQSSINDGEFTDFNFDENGLLATQVTFNTNSPCICSINIAISANGEYFDTLSISGVFVNKFSTVDFIAYPSHYINEQAGQIIALTKSNYKNSPGVQFYGEGHTEVINLSASGLARGDTACWFIGNSASEVSTGISNLSTVTVSQSTAYVSVSSALYDRSVYPINLWATNSSITTAGPYIKYDDVTGDPEFYPFFASTIDVHGMENRQPTRESIRVLEYPHDAPPIFNNPFPSSVVTLPVDYKIQNFVGYVTNPTVSSIVSQTFAGTQWELQAISDVGEWSVMTAFLSSVFAYQFQLSYDETINNILLPTFTASPDVPTTFVLYVSSFTDAYINLAPHDWLPKRNYYSSILTAKTSPLPYTKLYVPNYYNPKGQSVPIIIVDTPDLPLKFQRVTITAPQSPDTLILSDSSLSGTMQFNKLGIVNLSAAVILENVDSGLTQEIDIIFSNALEVVTTYDEVDEHNFHSTLTPLALSYNYLPRLAPNEWAIADNINSIIEKLYTTINELNEYTLSYEQKDRFYSWIGPKQLKAVWSDLECSTQLLDDVTTWAYFECTQEEIDRGDYQSQLWDYHICGLSKKDPTCLQKYCLEWKWRLRKQGASNTNVTWGTSKAGAEFAKKWFFEKCEIDPDPLNCDRDSWKVTTIDPLHFPIPSSHVTSRCSFVDAEVNYQTNELVVAYPTEINLIANDYYATYLARRGTVDDMFGFQNIVGVTIDLNGNIVVLDDTLPRVSVFNIVNNSFVLYSTWGSYGLVNNPRGLNKPQDIHIDSENSIWIADTGNKCIKKFTISGKPLMTITHTKFDTYSPLSICVDSKLNLHCLIETGVIVFDSFGNFSFEYTLPRTVYGTKKINVSFNREMIYITHSAGVIKYFRTGVFSQYTTQNIQCGDKQLLQGYGSSSQDQFRNLYVTVQDKILKIPDLQKLTETKANLPDNLYWSLNDLKIHKEEYIQPWVYLKSFHRLWDNIELLRSSLFYNLSGCKSYVSPTYAKTDLVIGQNEIVSNAVINRISEQLWVNMQSLIDYFNPDCEK